MRGTHRGTWWLALALGVGGGCGPEGGGAGPPDIVLISVDTLRRDHCSVYGYERDTTPTLRRVAAEGVRLERAYSPMPTTGPAHATLFTSLYPATHGVLENGARLAEEPLVLAEALRAHGYRTAAVVGSFVLDAKFGFDRGFEVYDDDFDPASSTYRRRTWEGHAIDGGFDRRADMTTRSAVHWIERERDPDHPFFLFVHYFDPHAPYVPPPPFDGRFDPRGGDPAGLGRLGAAYDGEIAFTDEAIGNLLDALANVQPEEQTLLVITADHGEGLGQHGYAAHGVLLYEEAVRVPLLFRWPGVLPAGRSIEAPVELLDVMPTLLEFVGIETRTEGLEGRSLAAALLGERPLDPERAVHLQRRLYRTPVVRGIPVRGGKWALRVGRWKYIEAPEEGTAELYDLEGDPGEIEDRSSALPDQARELADRLAAWRRAHATPRAAAGEVGVEDRERLRTLGYVD